MGSSAVAGSATNITTPVAENGPSPTLGSADAPTAAAVAAAPAAMVILVSGDVDFAGDVRYLRQGGIPVALAIRPLLLRARPTRNGSALNGMRGATSGHRDHPGSKQAVPSSHDPTPATTVVPHEVIGPTSSDALYKEREITSNQAMPHAAGGVTVDWLEGGADEEEGARKSDGEGSGNGRASSEDRNQPQLPRGLMRLARECIAVVQVPLLRGAAIVGSARRKAKSGQRADARAEAAAGTAAAELTGADPVQPPVEEDPLSAPEIGP